MYVNTEWTLPFFATHRFLTLYWTQIFQFAPLLFLRLFTLLEVKELPAKNTTLATMKYLYPEYY